jgi:hypothetical protein
MLIRIKNWTKYLLIFLIMTSTLFFSLAIYTNVPTEITLEDKKVFDNIDVYLSNPPLTFEQEIVLINKVQLEIFKRAPLGEGIAKYQAREPQDLMRIGHGLCYDRSRTFDKLLHSLGFKTRHVYLLYKENKSFLAAFFHYKQPSHAVTEVLTSKGWIFVDSNTPWLAITRQGEPVNADAVWQRFNEFDNAPLYLKNPWWAIRGMYSRKGHLYSPYILFPDFNWYDFFTWLFEK